MPGCGRAAVVVGAEPPRCPRTTGTPYADGRRRSGRAALAGRWRRTRRKMSTSGTWQPRALKKRASEFNTGDAPASVGSTSAAGSSSSVAPPPPEKTAAASSSSSTWNGAADLDDLEEDREAKRPRTDEAAAPVSAPAAAPAPDPNRDEVAEGAPRLAAHITSAAKFNKVAAMAYALLEGGRVTRENAGAFFAVLAAAMAEPTRLRDKTYRVAFRKLFRAAVTRAHLFPESAQLQLRVWEVHVLAQADLFTDDTFQFNHAAKRVRECLEGLPCVYKALEPEGAKHHAEAERPVWAEALYDCVEAAMQHHKYGWAKTTCDMLVKATVDRRQNFSEAQQVEIQAWNARCKGQKVVRQQEYASQRREQTSFERKEAEWSSAEIAMANKKADPGGGGGGGGLDGWCAKQSLYAPRVISHARPPARTPS